MSRADLSMGVRIAQQAAGQLLLEHGWSARDLRRELGVTRAGLRALLWARARQHPDRS